MELETIVVPEEEAKEQARLLKQLFRENASIRKNVIYKDLQRAYGHMKHGGKVIDIYQAFKDAGIGEDGHPKIAIVRADAKVCHLYKYPKGRAIFSHKGPTRYGIHGYGTARKSEREVELPEGTFEWSSSVSWSGEHRKTTVPIIPPAILIDQIRYHLRNYFILWEVEDWKSEPPKDPLLLKLITPNLFAVLATWDLSELERAIIKAHIVS